MPQLYKFYLKEQNGVFALLKSWDKDSINFLKFEAILNEILSSKIKTLQIDFRNLSFLDSAGVRFLLALKFELESNLIKCEFVSLNAKFENLITLCSQNYTRIKDEKKIKFIRIDEYFIKFGEFCCKLLEAFKKFLSFIGGFFIACFNALKSPLSFRFTAFLYHIENSAIKALPIVSLTAILIGFVLTYQAAYQLARFGANIFVVDLIGISATRELAPLIVAIVIAGRSASAYTAQIGVMKLTDEISAMNTMGFKSYEFIILPRVLALIISLPLIVAIADIISIFGAMIIAKLNLDINYGEFLRRFKEAVELKHIIIGLIKAPIFGAIIGLIACFRGFEVKSTTQSIGIYTTKSVVETIFWVIAFDAIFSILLTRMGF